MNYRIIQNEDAVSISVGFILTFSITVLVFSAVILSFYMLTTQSEKIAMQDSFEILGSGLAMRINTVDALINMTGYYGGAVNTLEYEISIPVTIANEGYSINITNATKKLILEAENGAIAWVPFNTSVNFEEKKIHSSVEDYKLTYNKNENLIKIEKQ